MQDYAVIPREASTVQTLLNAREIKRGFAFIQEIGSEFDKELIRICEIPAPFNEGLRAAYVQERFQQAKLASVHIDREGNVIGVRRGRDDAPSVIISAHLDTVFPAGTDVRIKRNGARLSAPGVSDNACGLASLVVLAQLFEETSVRTQGNVYFVATVGEEGEGDLRGVRHLFTNGEFSSGVDYFVSLDGPGLERITNQALGSRRFRVTIGGPGGHSWGDFGVVNPVHALGRAIARFAAYPAPISPRTSYNIGRVEGGNSVNAIPQRASMTVDMRSVSEGEIDKIESYLRRVIELAVREETSLRAMSDTRLTFDLELVGERPSGETSLESVIVRTALECSRALGIEPRLDCSSTDSNVPISLGIPAITVGVGGASGNCHSLMEWYEPTGRELGLKRLLLLSCALAGLEKKPG
jgi:acetylornithine deacetylase/succinyl-diaminopimelate desuccinylase-like protein